MISDAKQLLDLLSEKWYSRYTLYVGSFLSFLVAFELIKYIFIDSPYQKITQYLWFIQVVVGLISAIVLILFWFYSRRYPKRNKEKIGIVIAIRDNKKETREIKNEVIEQFEELVKSTSSGAMMQIIPLKDFRAS